MQHIARLLAGCPKDQQSLELRCQCYLTHLKVHGDECRTQLKHQGLYVAMQHTVELLDARTAALGGPLGLLLFRSGKGGIEGVEEVLID